MDGIQPAITPFDWQNIQRPETGDSPERIRETAGQFESLLIGMMMKSMRESSGGWLGTGGEQSLSSISDLAEQQVAQSLAASGGFGLADMVVAGLKRAESAGAKTPESVNGK